MAKNNMSTSRLSTEELSKAARYNLSETPYRFIDLADSHGNTPSYVVFSPDGGGSFVVCSVEDRVQQMNAVCITPDALVLVTLAIQELSEQSKTEANESYRFNRLVGVYKDGD